MSIVNQSGANAQTELKQARLREVHKRRRVIYNDDGEEMAHDEADTVEGFLAPRLKPLVETHVDTISWSMATNCSLH